jgi:hypothetical protein
MRGITLRFCAELGCQADFNTGGGRMEKPHAKSAATSAELNLPPYGLINTDNASYLAKRPMPEGFSHDPASPSPALADEWDEWLGALAYEMADFLWPVYENNKWVGAAASSAIDLTRADLDIIKSLQPMMDARIDGANCPTERHRVAWLHEDEGAPRVTMAFYHAQWPAELEADLNRAIVTGGIEIARPASQGLKRRFQRPRPQLTALLFDLPGGLEVQPSKSAITPAMISGHCIQGTMALAQIHFWLAGAIKSKVGLLELVERFLIDTGDRRVYAGLHYPSDNVSSWFVALRLCERLYGGDAARVRSALWNAIRTHSTVYRAMNRYGGLYQGLIARLEAAANPAPAAE